MNKSKVDFIADLLSEKKLNPQEKERLFHLASKEIKNLDLKGENLSERVKEIEDKIDIYLNNKTLSSKNSNNSKKTKSNKKSNKKHDPITTVKILKKFKYEDNSGLKELVHEPKNNESFTEEDFSEMINKAKKAAKSLPNIPTGTYLSIQDLIKLMEKEGLKCFRKTSKHPYLNKNCDKIPKENLSNYENFKDSKGNIPNYITYMIQNFKKNYRFSTEDTEATVLKHLVKNIFEKEGRSYPQSGDRNKTVAFSSHNGDIRMPVICTRVEDSAADFFTWVPSVRKALYEIALDILKHANLRGAREFKTDDKSVDLSIEMNYDDINDLETRTLSILDRFSVCNKNPNDVHDQLKDKLREILLSVCDWSVEYDHKNGEAYRLNLLYRSNQIRDIEGPLNFKIGGFKHKFTFYV